MTSNARDWGLTILRLWMGLLIAHSGYLKVTGSGTSLAILISLQNLSVAAWLTVGTHLVFLLGGAAIFLGVAVRMAAFLTALAAAHTLWKSVGLDIFGLIDAPQLPTILIVCVVLILAGPGRLNLGAALRKG